MRGTGQGIERTHKTGRRKKPIPVAIVIVVTLLASIAPARADVPTIGNAPSIDFLIAGVDYSYQADAPVLRLYQAFFNRAPDLEGAKYWLGIRRQGFSALQIAGFMSASQEFRNNYDGTDNAEFTRRVYTNVLGRDFDQAGYDYWLDLLNKGPARNGLDRPGMVFYVTDNDEFRNNYRFGEPQDPGVFFGDGLFDVGNGPGEVPPFEVYVSDNPGRDCLIERLSSFDGRPESVVQSLFYANAPQVIIQTQGTDVGIRSTNCGTFYLAHLIDLAPPEQLTSGAAWMIGTQVTPGLYYARPNGNDCGFVGLISFIEGDASVTGFANIPDADQVIAEFLPTDAAIEISPGCGVWTPFEDTIEDVEANFSPLTGFANGIYLRGFELPEGAIYETDGIPNTQCEIDLLADLTGEPSSIVESFTDQFPGSGVRLEITTGYVAIQFRNCGQWTRVG